MIEKALIGAPDLTFVLLIKHVSLKKRHCTAVVVSSQPLLVSSLSSSCKYLQNHVCPLYLSITLLLLLSDTKKVSCKTICSLSTTKVALSNSLHLLCQCSSNTHHRHHSRMTTIQIVTRQCRSANLSPLPKVARLPRQEKPSVIFAVND